jgi:hypothetical protein
MPAPSSTRIRAAATRADPPIGAAVAAARGRRRRFVVGMRRLADVVRFVVVSVFVGERAAIGIRDGAGEARRPVRLPPRETAIRGMSALLLHRIEMIGRGRIIRRDDLAFY